MARNMRRFREIFHVSAERMEYYYVLREEMPDPITGVFGYIFNDSCDGLKIALEVDNEYMEQKNYTAPTLYIDPESYRSECRIVMKEGMAKRLIKKDPVIVFELWHELGHFHTMEDHVEEYLENCAGEGGYTAEHYMAILDNRIMDYEAAADDFAVSYYGENGAIIALNGMIAAAKKNPKTANDRGYIMDLLNRKRRISGMGGEVIG